MHKARANILEPLHKQLNPQYYLGTSRSIDLELGNIYREILDLKDGAGWAPSKVRLKPQNPKQNTSTLSHEHVCVFLT